MANQGRLADAGQMTKTTIEPNTGETAMQQACHTIPVVHPAHTMAEIKTSAVEWRL